MSQAFSRRLEKLPDVPGVYFFLKTRMRADGNADKRRWPRREDILYIGRATSLRNRVRSYFAPDIAEKRSQWIAKMLPLIKSIDYRKTDSVLEAVLLEADLIKKFQPPYNTGLKDDKSFNCVVITRENFPAVLAIRSKDIDFTDFQLKTSNLKLKTIYGPYPAGFHLQTAMEIIRRILPYRDAKCLPDYLFRGQNTNSLRGDTIRSRNFLRSVQPLGKRWAGKPCFNRQLGLCPGTCTGEISRDEYAKTIRNLRLFFEGRKVQLLKLLECEMKAAAKRQEFEKAGELKRQLFALRHIQDVALITAINSQLPRLPTRLQIVGQVGGQATTNYRIEAYDLSHFGGKEIVGAMAVVENGVARPSEYRLFKLRGLTGSHETAGLREILRRRFHHPEWSFPHLIVVDGNEVQKQAAESVLRGIGQTIPVVAVVKDERHRPREVLGLGHPRSSVIPNPRQSVLLANSEAHRFALRFQRRSRML